MKRTVLALLSAILVVGCVVPDRAEAELLFRHYFIGGVNLSKDTNSAKLKSVWALPETRSLIKEISGKLSKTPFRVLESRLPKDAKAREDLVLPLIDGLMRSESFSEIHGPLDRPEILLAVRADSEETGRWSTNLWQLSEAWSEGNPRAIKVGQFSGWEGKPAGQVLQCFEADGWVIVGAGSGPLTRVARALGEIAKGGKPAQVSAGSWWSVRADLNRLGGKLPGLSKLPLGILDLSTHGAGEYLRTKGSLTLTRSLPKQLEPWLIPTNNIMDNIVSFTSARGLKTLLGSLEVWKNANLSQPPGQIMVWGPNVEYSGFLYASTPYADPTNEIRRMAIRVPKLLSEELNPKMGRFVYATNSASLSMVGLPYVLPHIKAFHEGSQGYLGFGMFPQPPVKTRPPPALMGQLFQRDELLYYDWEITERRLYHARQIYQLGDIIGALGFARNASPTQSWVTKVAPLLGNTITEAEVTSPTELSFTRKSHLGLTGFEIYSLVDWIESPGFPLTWEKNQPRQLLSPERLKELHEKAAAAKSGKKNPGSPGPVKPKRP